MQFKRQDKLFSRQLVLATVQSPVMPMLIKRIVLFLCSALFIASIVAYPLSFRTNFHLGGPKADDTFVSWNFSTATGLPPDLRGVTGRFELPKDRRVFLSCRAGALRVAFASPDPAASFSDPGHHISIAGFQLDVYPFRTQVLCSGIGSPQLTKSDAQIAYEQRLSSSHVMSIGMPLWAPLVMFGSYPLVTFWRGPFRRRHRRNLGLCFKCGYNLAGAPEPRCPECGTATRQPMQAQA